ncbi:MAG: enoyl-CoA hydratase-related protein, partial [Melioribacteraceae bacterium]
MEYKNILFDVINKIAVVTVNRPEKLNALNQETLGELKDCFNAIKMDNDINVAIITGAGEKAFVAGADISELNKIDSLSGKLFSESGQEIFNLIEKLR